MTTAAKPQTAIIFGSTGAIGTSLAEYLSSAHPTWKIRAVSRSLSTDSRRSRLAKMNLPNVTMVQGSPSEDKEQVLQLCQDADLIFCCVGFPQYEAKYWAKHWPKIVDNLLHTIRESNGSKKLIFCDNLYAYGAGENLRPDGARIPASLKTKPAIRATMHNLFRQHMQDYPGTLTAVGASDFFGPHVTSNGFLGDTLTGKIVVDEASPLAIGRVDVVHDFCYAPDFAKALAMASVHEKAYDRFWIAPHSLKGMSLQEIGNRVAAKAGRPTPVRFTTMGPCLVHFMSPFMSFMSEMREMLPNWTSDYTVDDSEFVREFEMEATPADEALDALVKFYQEQKNL